MLYIFTVLWIYWVSKKSAEWIYTYTNLFKFHYKKAIFGKFNAWIPHFDLKTQNYMEISPAVSHPKNDFSDIGKFSLGVSYQQCSKDLFSNSINSKRCQILQHIYQTQILNKFATHVPCSCLRWYCECKERNANFSCLFTMFLHVTFAQFLSPCDVSSLNAKFSEFLEIYCLNISSLSQKAFFRLCRTECDLLKTL